MNKKCSCDLKPSEMHYNMLQSEKWILKTKKKYWIKAKIGYPWRTKYKLTINININCDFVGLVRTATFNSTTKSSFNRTNAFAWIRSKFYREHPSFARETKSSGVKTRRKRFYIAYNLPVHTSDFKPLFIRLSRQ